MFLKGLFKKRHCSASLLVKRASTVQNRLVSKKCVRIVLERGYIEREIYSHMECRAVPTVLSSFKSLQGIAIAVVQSACRL